MKRDFVVVLTGTDKALEADAKDLLTREGFKFRLRSMDMSDRGWQVVMEIQNADQNEIDLQKLMGELETSPTIKSASVLAPNLTLPI